MDLSVEAIAEKVEDKGWGHVINPYYGSIMEWSTENPENIYLPGIANIILSSGNITIYRVQHSRSDVDWEIALGYKSAKEIAADIYNIEYEAQFGKYDFEDFETIEKYDGNEDFELAVHVWNTILERISLWPKKQL